MGSASSCSSARIRRSYGKDLGDLGALEKLLPQLAAVDGILRVRVAYLQPAELRPGLIEVLCSTPGVAPYFDLSFQHASGPLLRRMRRFGDRSASSSCSASAALSPDAGRAATSSSASRARPTTTSPNSPSSWKQARLDAVGVFGYSDEDGTEACRHDPQGGRARHRGRVEQVTDLVDELVTPARRGAFGEVLEVLLEEVSGRWRKVGRPTRPRRSTAAASCEVSRRRSGSWCGFGWSVPRAWTWSPSSGAACARRAGLRIGARSVTAESRSAAPEPLWTGPLVPVVPDRRAAGDEERVGRQHRERADRVPAGARPGVPRLPVRGDGHEDSWRIAATVVFAVASFTDRIDGEIARRRGLITDFGKLVDPIADKVLIGSALIGLSLGRPGLVGDGGGPGPRDRRDGAAVLGDPARGDAGQPWRQDQDAARGARDRPLRASAVRLAAHRGSSRHGRGDRHGALITGADYVGRAVRLRRADRAASA